MSTFPNLVAEQVTALQSDDLSIRNGEIAALRAAGVPAAEIAEAADIATATVYRIAKNWEPDHGYIPVSEWKSVADEDGVADMSEEFAADAEAEEHAAEVAAKDAALAEQAEQGITAAYLGTDIDGYIQQLLRGNDADNYVGTILRDVRTTTGEERRKAIVTAARIGIERKYIAAAAGVKSVGRIIRAAARAGEMD